MSRPLVSAVVIAAEVDRAYRTDLVPLRLLFGLSDASGKLKELVENILESFDTLPHPIPPNYFFGHPYLSRLSTASTIETRPLLNASTLRKLTRLLSIVTKKAGGPDGQWWGSSLDEGDPARLMSLLRGSLEEAEAVGEVWGAQVRDETSLPKAGSKSPDKKGSKSPEKAAARSKAKAKAGDVPEEVKEEDQDGDGAVGEAAGLDGFEVMMEVALEAALATDCCLILLASKGVPAQVRPSVCSLVSQLGD